MQELWFAHVFHFFIRVTLNGVYTSPAQDSCGNSLNVRLNHPRFTPNDSLERDAYSTFMMSQPVRTSIHPHYEPVDAAVRKRRKKKHAQENSFLRTKPGHERERERKRTDFGTVSSVHQKGQSFVLHIKSARVESMCM